MALSKDSKTPQTSVRVHVSTLTEIIEACEYNHAMVYLRTAVRPHHLIRVYGSLIATMGESPDASTYLALKRFRLWLNDHGGVYHSLKKDEQ
jgi:3'-phosphoadenosine 5'-phosphosulfate sulfotransferase